MNTSALDTQALREYIDENGIKHNFIAKQIGTTRYNFSYILSGKTRCTLENYVAICNALDVPIGKFLKNGVLQTSS